MSERMFMKESFVKFLIDQGPVWDTHVVHDGKIECFQVMKISGSDLNFPLAPVLIEPVKVAIKVDHIASSLQDPTQCIRGEIVEIGACIKRMPGFEDDIGIDFLTKGTSVELYYNINAKSGYLTFWNRHDDEGCMRMRVQTDGWIHALRCMNSKRQYNQCNPCYEVINYARLHDPAMDYHQIKTFEELVQHATLTPSNRPGEPVLLIGRNFPIVWL